MLPSITTKPLIQVLSLLFTLVLWLTALRHSVLNGEVERKPLLQRVSGLNDITHMNASSTMPGKGPKSSGRISI